MKVTVHEVTEITRKLEVTLPAADLQEELDKVYQQIGREAKLKGFRPGKIPREVLEQNFRTDAESDAVRHLITESYPEALRSADLQPVSTPEVSVRHFKIGEDFCYDAVVEVRPKIKVKGYENLTLSQKKIDVAEEEVHQGLQSLQERAAQLLPVTETRPAREGDIVVFDYRGIKEGKPHPEMKGAGQMAELGRGTLLPEMETAFVGMSPGEKKEVGEYEIHLKELKEKKIPELDDDFAKDLGQFATLTEVKEKIREHLTKEKEGRGKGELARAAIQKLAEKNSFPVPEGMIRVELEAMLRQFEANLRHQGVTLQQSGITPEQFSEQNRGEAKLRVTATLLLEAIAEQEKIEVKPEEIEHRIEVMAQEAGQSADAWKKYYREKNLLPSVAAALLEEKTLDFVLSKATIKPTE